MIVCSGEKPYHNRVVETIEDFWKFLGAISLEEQTGRKYFKPDLVMDLSYSLEIANQLDCQYIWIENVKEHPCSSEKKEWVAKMLSKKWLILRYHYGETFSPQRPVTYVGMSDEETKQVLYKLQEQHGFFKRKIKEA